MVETSVKLKKSYQNKLDTYLHLCLAQQRLFFTWIIFLCYIYIHTFREMCRMYKFAILKVAACVSDTVFYLYITFET